MCAGVAPGGNEPGDDVPTGGTPPDRRELDDIFHTTPSATTKTMAIIRKGMDRFIWGFGSPILDSISSCRCGECSYERMKNGASVTGTERVFARPFRVRHQAKDISAFAADARDVVTRAVHVCFISYVAFRIAITKDDSAVAI